MPKTYMDEYKIVHDSRDYVFILIIIKNMLNKGQHIEETDHY